MSFRTVKAPAVKIEKRPGCLQAALAIIGDKWSPLLLSQLVSGAKTFGELEIALGGVSPRTLSSRLDDLEAGKIIKKSIYNKRPPRYRYSLTDKGRELQVILKAMAKWGDRYHSID